MTKRWIIKIGDHWLETTCWCLLTDKKEDAFEFSSEANANKFAKDLHDFDDFVKLGIYVEEV